MKSRMQCSLMSGALVMIGLVGILPLANAQEESARIAQLEARLAQLEARVANIEAVQNKHGAAPANSHDGQGSGGGNPNMGGMGHM